MTRIWWMTAAVPDIFSFVLIVATDERQLGRKRYREINPTWKSFIYDPSLTVFLYLLLRNPT